FARAVAHPGQRNVGQAPLPGRVAAAHVAVGAAEPHLPDHLAGFRLEGPAGGLERRPALVDGQRLAGEAHRAAELDVVEAVFVRGERAQAAHRDAERAHRVPYADELDGRGLLTHHRAFAAEAHRTLVVGVAVVGVERDRLAVAVGRVHVQDPALAHHAGQAARG